MPMPSLSAFSALSGVRVLPIFAGLLLLAACSEDAPPPAAQASPPPPQVSVVEVRAEAVPLLVELPGRTVASLTAEVRPQVSGIIKARPFREGGEVSAGELLYEIEPASYRAASDSAQASLARAQANVAAARVKAERFADLRNRKAISEQAADDAQAARLLAEAEVAVARAALDKARVELDFTRVLAPIAGRVGRSEVTQGALVTANQAAPLVTIQQIDPIYVDLTQSSVELLRLRNDLASGRVEREADSVAVELQLEDGSVYAEMGHLVFSEASVDASTGSVLLRAEFPNPRGDLLPGMYVRAQLAQAVVRDAILVPHAALGRDPRGNPTVLVVNAEDIVELRVVRTERATGEQWVVREGLAPGERVIVAGLQRARPGAKVQVEDVSASAAATPEHSNNARPAANSAN